MNREVSQLADALLQADSQASGISERLTSKLAATKGIYRLAE